MKCNNCKQDAPQDSKFCVHCGEKIHQEINNISDSKLITDIKKHLEFIGYEIDDSNSEEKDVVRFFAMHKNHPNLIITHFEQNNILLFVTIFKMPKVENEIKRNKLLEIANYININLATLSTFGINEKFDGIIMSSWYPAKYIKTEFSNFLDDFRNEINRITAYEELKIYY